MVTKKRALDTQIVEDCCPRCGINGEENFEYGDIGWKNEESESSIYQEVTCNGCDLNFKQWYTAQFAAQEVMLKIAEM